MNEQSLHIGGGVVGPESAGLVIALVDNDATFITDGVIPGDVVRLLRDGSKATISAVGATTLSFFKVLSGGQDDVLATDDHYVIQRPLVHSTVVGIQKVIYDGAELHYLSADEVMLRDLGLVSETRRPRYWTVDEERDPTTLRILGAPRVTGQSTLVSPMAPLLMPWEDNLVVFLSEEPQRSVNLVQEVNIPRAFHYPIALLTAGQLLAREGQYQNLAVSAGCNALANTHLSALGVQ